MYSSLNVWDVVYIDCVWFPVGGPGHVQQDDMCKKTLFKNKLQGESGKMFELMTEATECGV